MYDIDTVVLRYFNIFGPRQRPDGPYAAAIPAFLARMQTGEPPVIYGDGQQTRDFTYIDNAVQANLAAADADVGGEVLNIGAGERLSVRALVDLLNDVLGTSLTPEHSDPRAEDVRHSSADIDRAERIIGYMPAVDATSGIRQLVDSVV
jgi:UDP-glucose 4-epimerase